MFIFTTMMKLIPLITLVLLSSTFSANAQKKNETGITVSEIREIKLAEKEAAKKAITVLSNGALLVRLNFKQKAIRHYEKFGNVKEAVRLRNKQIKINRNIIKAFNDLYSFSPIYFFAMEDSRMIVDGKHNELTFYDNNATADESIVLQSEDFLIAEFGMIEVDQSNNEGATTSMSALIVRSNDFVQLRDPFPFYSSYPGLGRVKKRYRMPVLRLQQRLEVFNNKSGVTK